MLRFRPPGQLPEEALVRGSEAAARKEPALVTVSPGRRFNTWDVDHPSALVHLPSGLRAHVCAYSDRAAAFTRFPAGKGVRLGPRTLDGSSVSLAVGHEGTELGLRFEQVGPDAARVRWWTERTGEWGLRFWVVVALEPADLAGPHDSSRFRTIESEPGALGVRLPDGWACVLGRRRPLLETSHADLAALEREYETHGYWYLRSRGTGGPLLALRYNLEEMPENRLAIGVATDADTALGRARSALEIDPGSDARPSSPRSLHTGRHDGALDAVRDVIGWNTVHDPVNRRPYTALSRNWSSAKFGGFGVWLDDVLYHALLAGILDHGLAEENLRAVFAGRTEAGNLPCLLTGRDAWVDRSQPPIGAFVTWLLYQRWGERRLLENAFETLLANHEWWWRERDGNGNGLLEYGTSPVGDGLYRGTALGARNESSMDNSPVHDEAVLVPESHTLDCEDVGLNSLLVLDAEMLALAAAELGRGADAHRLRARARAHAERIRAELWDSQRGVFANRLWSGRFVSSIAPTSFYPLIAGAATDAQAAALLGWLEDPQRFGGRFPLPSVSRDDPAVRDNVYWRGRIWPPLNFLVYHGLRRYGFTAEATALARRSYAMFAGPWREARQCAENYGAESGAVTDQPDTDTFYGWGALMPAMAVAEVCDVSPWEGWSVSHTGEDVRMGPLRCPYGLARLEANGGSLAVYVDDRPVLCSDIRGRLRNLRVEEGMLSVELPPSAPASSEREWLELPGIAVGAEIDATLDGAAIDDVDVANGSDGARFFIPIRTDRAEFSVTWRA